MQNDNVGNFRTNIDSESIPTNTRSDLVNVAALVEHRSGNSCLSSLFAGVEFIGSGLTGRMAILRQLTIFHFVIQRPIAGAVHGELAGVDFQRVAGALADVV